jgi:two-component system, chemotaxis family, sensor kinase CheA
VKAAPLTLALIEGFALSAAGETFIVPLESVVECLELPRVRQESDGGGLVALRGEPLPFIRLRDALALPGETPRRESMVVIRTDHGTVGIAVDLLLGATQAVVKPLGAAVGAAEGFCGSTILGSGRVGLILDVPVLVRHAEGGRTPEAALAESSLN